MVGLLILEGDGSANARIAIDDLVNAWKWLSVSAVYSGTHGAAVETALAIARDHALDVRLRPALNEPAESPADHDSITTELMMLARAHPGETIAIVTNANLIRCALAAFGGTAVDELPAVEITPSRVSSIGFASGLCHVLGVNMTPREIDV